MLRCPLSDPMLDSGSCLHADAALRSHGGVNVGHLAGAMKAESGRWVEDKTRVPSPNNPPTREAPLERGEACAVDAVGPAALLKALKAREKDSLILKLLKLIAC